MRCGKVFAYLGSVWRRRRIRKCGKRNWPVGQNHSIFMWISNAKTLGEQRRSRMSSQEHDLANRVDRFWSSWFCQVDCDLVRLLTSDGRAVSSRCSSRVFFQLAPRCSQVLFKKLFRLLLPSARMCVRGSFCSEALLRLHSIRPHQPVSLGCHLFAVIPVESGTVSEAVTGILPMLDEECITVGGSSDTWCRKLQRVHTRSRYYEPCKFNSGSFVLSHFAGPVEYASEAFLEKNRDLLSADLVECMKSSRNGFISKRFHEHARVFGTQATVDMKTGQGSHCGRLIFRCVLCDRRIKKVMR